MSISGKHQKSEYRIWCDQCAEVSEMPKVFVVGCAKSGTTWLEHMLNGHPELHVRGEGRYFWSLAQNMRQAFKQFNESLPGQGEEHHAWWPDQDFGFLLRTVIEASLARSLASLPRKPGLKMIGDKTPMHTLAIAPLQSLFPEAKFIHIIRDPRDATVSQWLFWAKKNDPRSFEDFVEYSITKVWPLNIESARRDGQPLGDRYTEVRYEDLIVDSRSEMSRLTQFLGVDQSDGAIGACLEAGNFLVMSGGRRRGEAGIEGQLVRKGVVGDWINHMPVELADRCCNRIGPLMRSCGYDPIREASPGSA